MIDNVSVKPMYVYFGKDQEQIQAITCVPGTSLGGKYFLFHDQAGAKHYAWFNTGASTDPAPAGGWVEQEVAILTTDSASQVATKLAAVLTAVTGFDSTASGSVVTLTATVDGYAQPARDGEGLGASGFAFKVTQLGSLERSAGCLQGDIEVSGFEQTKVDVTCHAGGTTIQKQIVSGYSSPTVSVVLQETDKESIKKVLIDYGMPTFTPVGTDKVEIFGYGPANVGSSNVKIPVRMHPVALDASDKSEDWNIWTAEISLDTFTFSGENVSTLPISITMYPDTTKPKGVQFFMIGDAEKAGY